MTAWSDERDAMLDVESKKQAAIAVEAFRATKGKELRAVAEERRTRRQAIETMRKKYEALRKVYLKAPLTTYDGWTQHGPGAEWEEVLAATRDDAVWDRLVETYDKRTP